MAFWDTSQSTPNDKTSMNSPATPRYPTTPYTPTGTDSPRPDSPVTPPPPGTHGEIEMELIALAHALYNLGCTAINDNTRERPGPDGSRPEKKIGARVNEIVQHLSTIEDLSQNLDTMIPMQVLSEVDNGRNPMLLTRERIERAALENQFINGKLDAIQGYVDLLDDALRQNFPELTPYLSPNAPDSSEAMEINTADEIKVEDSVKIESQ